MIQQVIAYYIGIFGRPDFTLERIMQTQPVLPALLLLAVTHLAVVLGIPFGLSALGIGSPYNEVISGFEVALLSGIVTIGLVHLVAGLAHGVVRLIGASGNYLGLLAAFGFISCVGIVVLPIALLHEWAMRQEGSATASNLLGIAVYPMLVLGLLIWTSVLGVLAVKKNYGVTTRVGLVAVVAAGGVALPVALILYATSFIAICTPMVGC